MKHQKEMEEVVQMCSIVTHNNCKQLISLALPAKTPEQSLNCTPARCVPDRNPTEEQPDEIIASAIKYHGSITNDQNKLCFMFNESTWKSLT